MSLIARIKDGVQIVGGLLLMAALTIGLMLGFISKPADAVPAPPASGVIQFDAGDYATSEAAGTVTLEIERVGGSVGQISATVQTFDGTATIGDDYAGVASPLTLTWADGNTAPKTLTLPISDDALDEPDETFTVVLTSAHAGAPTTATVTIEGTLPVPSVTPTPPATPTPMPTPTATPGPTPPTPPGPTPTPDPSPTATAVPVPRPAGIIEFAQAGYTVTEAECVVAVELQRVLGHHGEVMVTVGTSAGSALANQDYIPIGAANPVQITWDDGDTDSKVVLVKLVSDGTPELDETFNVVLLKTVGAGQGDSATSVVITETPVIGSGAKPATTGCTTDDAKADTPAAVGVKRTLAVTAPNSSPMHDAHNDALPLGRVLSVGAVLVGLAAIMVGPARRGRQLP